MSSLPRCAGAVSTPASRDVALGRNLLLRIGILVKPCSELQKLTFGLAQFEGRCGEQDRHDSSVRPLVRLEYGGDNERAVRRLLDDDSVIPKAEHVITGIAVDADVACGAVSRLSMEVRSISGSSILNRACEENSTCVGRLRAIGFGDIATSRLPTPRVAKPET